MGEEICPNPQNKELNDVSDKQAEWEKIYICIHKQYESEQIDEEKNILSDFALLAFDNKIFTQVDDKINYNEGKAANSFDKISKHYGRYKNVFRFICMLRNKEHMDKILSIIDQKCQEHEKETFIERLNLYLRRIELGEMDAKEFLGNEEFPGAFFNGYRCGEQVNIHENLNINFVTSNQCLSLTDIFNKKVKRMEEFASKLRRIKIYDNGTRVVTIIKNDEKINFSFKDTCSCRLVLKRVLANDDYIISIDINSNEIVYIELKINGIVVSLEKLLNFPFNNEFIQLAGKSICDVVQSFVVQEINISNKNWTPKDECLPIKTLEDLKNWKPPERKHFSEKLRNRKEVFNQPKTLICHDMRGGYLEDRFISGKEYENNYFFVHWAMVDIFVYFSHHLVTIPPCSWISAAHRNGVKVLGTFITEWDDGAKVCEELLKDEKSAHCICMQLVDIAVYYNFDGWLINIENQIKPSNIPVLRKFVKYLSERMHSFNPNSQVIWYDSVIKNGQLRWQNALNDLNRIFFYGCDGIFLNYNWTEEHLKQSLLASGSRITDVYVGVDVFGRGCLGGGGFCTNIAVAEARKFGLSVAIFAPGWVHECLEVKDFKENQFKFWEALQEFCPSRAITDLLYSSSFCPGFGNKMFRNGKIINAKPWFNLGLQQPQPLYSVPQNSTEGAVLLYNMDAFNGGGCLLLSGQTSGEAVELNFKILETSFQLETVCVVSFTFKPLTEEVNVALRLRASDDKKSYDIQLVSNTENFTNDSPQLTLPPSSPDELIKIGFRSREDTFPDHGWINRIYILKPTTQLYEIKAVSVILNSYAAQVDGNISVLFGELEILPMGPSLNFAYENLVCKYDDKNSQVINIQCDLLWNSNSSILYSDLYLQTESKEKEHICTTSQFSYKLEVSVNFVSEIQIILCLRTANTKQLPSAMLKIPLKL